MVGEITGSLYRPDSFARRGWAALVTVTSGLFPVTLRTLHDWWSPLIRMIIGFLFAWGVFELTEQRRRKRA